MGIKKKQFAVIDADDNLNFCDSKAEAIKEAISFANDYNSESYVVEILGSAKTHGRAYYEEI